ncbi:acetate--CoA ligase alpha subunit [Thermosphaera aggregans]|jgi:acetyl-CoA synthetase (ADP-forming)|uniref:Branched-chain acyl-CoA synthetase (ADP-forming) alpha subunit acetyl-CoA synthetase (ADP-forming) alpha subunit n=1 Tax=Thermosphaera aggregans (strain DSM 11486 / M11TL) TaxID=633148 RepID=D5U1J9_THEAM|nr:CoA-binding protein [Thermosphaera aggregans]ADG90999.1 branched-chain acyl-CoA synthetase (ADP-forming) alpha subunit; acetyl-CoA synthetase (ADP-forming) alpha subunit [Thermosphaera aggregans DSM 11486]
MVKALFEPKSIAVVGASRSPGKIGHVVLKNIKFYGYSGKIYPVNPNADEILGLKAYPSISSIPDEVDVAVITVPAQEVPPVIEECARKGVKVAVVITAGFSEVGNVEVEEKMVETARKYGMRILGPNIFGYAYTPLNINATFGPLELSKGNIAFITQSGALGIALMGWTIMNEIGLSALVSVGNMADLDVIELSEYLADDPHTKVITIYLEGLKPGYGREFVERMRKVTRKKPVIVIKAGRTQRGASAAASHTGSLAGSDSLYEAAFKQAGIIRTYTVEDMFDVARAFALQPLPKGDRTIIITNGGGVGVLATDAAELNNVKLIDPSPELKEKLKASMPWFGSPKNPVDLTGQAVADNYLKALKAALDSKEVDNVVLLYCRTAILDPRELAKAIVEFYQSNSGGKPIVAGFVGGEDTYEAIRYLNRNGIPAYGAPERAVYALSRMIWYSKYVSSSK